jgi:hypothetical protein
MACIAFSGPRASCMSCISNIQRQLTGRFHSQTPSLGPDLSLSRVEDVFPLLLFYPAYIISIAEFQGSTYSRSREGLPSSTSIPSVPDSRS